MILFYKICHKLSLFQSVIFINSGSGLSTEISNRGSLPPTKRNCGSHLERQGSLYRKREAIRRHPGRSWFTLQPEGVHHLNISSPFENSVRVIVIMLITGNYIIMQ